MLGMFKCLILSCCMLLYKYACMCCEGDKMAWKIALYLSTRVDTRACVPWPCGFNFFITKLEKCPSFWTRIRDTGVSLAYGRVEP
ncbi:hypothetical protein F383_37139 [Gossypium arboreum]|uniref:Secreted protein n=1 Tax=Gossypium arboreum TaxID=29729 RepID=A0A0B0MBQ3_GOSAR|nr:hypothetical protein F383_37139 [Gossypium arboreum]